MGGCGAKKKSMKDFLKEDDINRAALLEDIDNEDNAVRQHETVQLSFRCQNVKDIGLTDFPHTLLVLKEQTEEKHWITVGSTEVIHNELNPQFLQTLNVEYYAQEVQPMMAIVYEIYNENEAQNLSDDLALGSATFLLHALLTNTRLTLELPLLFPGRQKPGSLTVTASQKKTVAKDKLITFQAAITFCEDPTIEYSYQLFQEVSEDQDEEDAKKKGPYERGLHRVLAFDSKGGWYNQLDRSYKWRHCQLPYLILAKYSPKDTFTINVQGRGKSMYGEDNEVVVLGTYITSVDELTRNGLSLPLKIQAESYGLFEISDVSIQEEYKFIEFIHAGATLQLAVCFDFTLTNHVHEYNTEDLERNPYTMLIRSLGGALLTLDPEQRAIVLGHGAGITGLGRSYCFALNGDILAPEVTGLSSVIELYLYTLTKVRLCGPTYFAEQLEYCANIAEEYSKDKSNLLPRYLIQLILADGSPIDLEATKDALVRCSELPISIIIIGLDSDLCDAFRKAINPAAPIFSKKLQTAATRDVVIYTSYSLGQTNMPVLVRTVFHELQRQYVTYMALHKAEPRPKETTKPRDSETSTDEVQVFSPYPGLMLKLKMQLAAEKKEEEKKKRELEEKKKLLAAGKKVEDEKTFNLIIAEPSPSERRLVRAGTLKEKKAEASTFKKTATLIRPKDIGITAKTPGGEPNDNDNDDKPDNDEKGDQGDKGDKGEADSETKKEDKKEAKKEEKKEDKAQEKERLEEEEMYKRIDKLIEEGFPTFNTPQLRQAGRDKTYVNNLIPDSKLKNLIVV